MTGRLEGKVAIVTGAGCVGPGWGNGRATCVRFAEEGASIFAVDLKEEAMAETLTRTRKAGGTIEPHYADVTDRSAVEAMVDTALERFGRLDILVNNAGGGNRSTAKANGPPFTRVQQEGWDEHMAINLRTLFAVTKAAIPHLTRQEGGSIVNVSSIAGLLPDPGMPAYAAAKAGALSLTRSLALELGSANFRVNAICPGLLYTRAWKLMASNIQKNTPAYADMDAYEVFLKIVQSQTPLGREQTPEDIGKLTVFLCSDDSSNNTGQILSVDGGMLLHRG